LRDYVETVHAALIQTENPMVQSYDTSKISNINIDIALVDGPPILICGTDTRLTPLRWAASHLARSGAIFLDDSARPSEQNCIELLKREFPHLTVIPRAAEKGLAEIRNQ
jgi:hypothetical protein